MRLIDADALLEKSWGFVEEIGAEVVEVEDIKTAPTIEPPVVHGRWIDTNFYGMHHEQIYRCSNCDDEYEELKLIDSVKFCPSCGALMDAKEDAQ